VLIVLNKRPLMLARAIEQVAPRSPLIWWQVFFPDRSAIILFLLISALVLACIYRLTLDGATYLHAGWATVIAGLLLYVLSFGGWTVLSTWLALLVLLIMLAVVRLESGGRVLFVLTALALSLWGLWFVPLALSFYLLIWSKRRALAAYSLIIGVLGLATHETWWVEFYSTLNPTLPIAAIILWLVALVGLFALFKDEVEAAQSVLVIVCLAVGVIAGITLNPILLLAVFVGPLTIGLARTFAQFSLRTQFVATSVGIFLLLPHPLAEPDQQLAQAIRTHHMPDTVTLINYPDNYAQFVRAAGIAQQVTSVPQFIILNADTALEIRANRANLIAAREAFRYPNVFLFGDNNHLSTDTEVVFNLPEEPADRFTLGFYHTPLRNTIYRFNGLVLSGQMVLSANATELQTTFHPGDTVLVDTWWRCEQIVTDNYLAKVSLVTPDGQPVTSSEGLIAGTFTGAWQVGSLHHDRQVLELPPTLGNGDYNLVISMHGTSNNSANVTITGSDGTQIGLYGYLTTIRVS
jgi:hypothetical protein